MFDLIGDIHGHADRLSALLSKLGYRRNNGAYSHSDRKAIFLGDLIDRGPAQLETVNIVRAMVDAGTAECILGNHEFNAVGLATRDWSVEDGYLRPRTDKNLRQQQAFLREVGLDTPLHEEIIEWFRTLPLFVEKEGFRAVHACWHEAYLQILTQSYLDDRNVLLCGSWEDCSRKESIGQTALATVISGTEVDLPDGVSFTDVDGVTRTTTRTRWWDQAALTYQDAGMVTEDLKHRLPAILMPESFLVTYDDDKPLFFGHFWLSGSPAPLGPKMACLDYSIGRGTSEGKLCAYRWDGEQVIEQSKFVWVDGA